MRLLLFAALLGSVLSLAIRKDVGGYSDEFARYKMLSFAAAAYSDDPNLCMKSAYPNTGNNNTVYFVREEQCDDKKDDTCKGFTAISHTDKAIIISFRGTQSFLQIIQEGIDTITKPERFSAGGYVSGYFYNAYKAVWYGGLKNDFLSLRNRYPDYELWLTGHSLGGAMASLAAAELAYMGFVDTQHLKLVTFGQPRVGDKVYAAAHDALVPYSYRVVHNRDLIAQNPPRNLPDHGLLDGYVHHKAEVFYPNKMRVDDSFIVCNEEDEDNKCSDGQWFTLSIPDHFHYFEDHESILDYGIDGCPRSMVSK
ncbi:hypothetical protein QR680_015108 [Steinernema hermaphroditum]|uniref:Fungal lipase-type domain-containing protein n=1 Tax=Steinernema hermaphroditum TaxID=289476 RepID=A0AA39M509_9BILA|nr:hypothetical protein QR680_015108 [Steinernema hermaphroditum]